MPRTTRNSLDAALPFSAELSSPGKIENKTVKKEQPKKVKPVKKASSSPQRKSLASAKAAKFESARRTHKPPTYPPKMSDLLSSGEHMPRKAFKDRVSRAISRRNILPNKILASGMKSGPNFPMKMHMVLELADEMEYSHVMSWTEDGRAFVIHDRKKSLEILRVFGFNVNKWDSIQRQLNHYQFKRRPVNDSSSSKTKDKMIYHEKFRRGESKMAKELASTRSKTCKGVVQKAKESFFSGHTSLAETPKYLSVASKEAIGRSSCNADTVKDAAMKMLAKNFMNHRMGNSMITGINSTNSRFSAIAPKDLVVTTKVSNKDDDPPKITADAVRKVTVAAAPKASTDAASKVTGDAAPKKLSDITTNMELGFPAHPPVGLNASVSAVLEYCNRFAPNAGVCGDPFSNIMMQTSNAAPLAGLIGLASTTGSTIASAESNHSFVLGSEFNNSAIFDTTAANDWGRRVPSAVTVTPEKVSGMDTMNFDFNLCESRILDTDEFDPAAVAKAATILMLHHDNMVSLGNGSATLDLVNDDIDSLFEEEEEGSLRDDANKDVLVKDADSLDTIIAPVDDAVFDLANIAWQADSAKGVDETSAFYTAQPSGNSVAKLPPIVLQDVLAGPNSNGNLPNPTVEFPVLLEAATYSSMTRRRLDMEVGVGLIDAESNLNTTFDSVATLDKPTLVASTSLGSISIEGGDAHFKMNQAFHSL